MFPSSLYFQLLSSFFSLFSQLFYLFASFTFTFYFLLSLVPSCLLPSVLFHLVVSLPFFSSRRFILFFLCLSFPFCSCSSSSFPFLPPFSHLPPLQPLMNFPHLLSSSHSALTPSSLSLLPPPSPYSFPSPPLSPLPLLLPPSTLSFSSLPLSHLLTHFPRLHPLSPCSSRSRTSITPHSASGPSQTGARRGTSAATTSTCTRT